MGCCCFKTTADAEKQGLKTAKSSGMPSIIGKAAGYGSSCSEEVLRKKLEQASSTRVLALRECGLKTLPDGATKDELANLRSADIASNRITVLPPSIQVWTSLQSLDLSDNLLEQLPVTIGKLAQLKKLILSKNKLSTLPDEVAELHLTDLKCDDNMLIVLPDAFGGSMAETLEELDVSGNRIAQLPQSVCSLRSVTRISVQQNKLSSLILQFKSDQCLARLQYINAADNAIGSIDTETLQLPSLSELWLKGNPMDREVLQQTQGFDAFAERRKQCLDKKIEQKVVGHVELEMCGL